MQFGRILSDLIVEAQLIRAGDSFRSKDDVQRIAMVPYNKPLQPILANGLRPVARPAER